MSLFGNPEYRWRETYLVLFDQQQRPSENAFRQAIERLGERYEIDSLVANDLSQVDSITLLVPADNAGMDISFIQGEEVAEQLEQMRSQLAEDDLLAGDEDNLAQLDRCNARFDILHFEHLLDFSELEADEEFMDPAGLLIVAQTICGLCQGVAVDPQSGTFL